jgi:hypothetical protein
MNDGVEDKVVPAELEYVDALVFAHLRCVY